MSRNRQLDETTGDVWAHNCWDNMEWTEEREAEALKVIQRQQSLSPHISNNHPRTPLDDPSRWDAFYGSHDRWFFKDRNWLPTEFPELFDPPGSRVLEIGCGAGNTIFPLLRHRKEHHQGPLDGPRIFACDYSAKAVELVRGFREYDPSWMRVFQHDLGDPDTPTFAYPLDGTGLIEEIPAESIDVVVLIFVLSALDPSRLAVAVGKIARVLKPGGLVLFRDYGLYDMTQLRFKPDRLVKPDLYLRGDGTAVHYFSVEEVEGLFGGFERIDCRADRRLLVNRFRKLTMYRIWIQAKFRKIETI